MSRISKSFYIVLFFFNVRISRILLVVVFYRLVVAGSCNRPGAPKRCANERLGFPLLTNTPRRSLSAWSKCCDVLRCNASINRVHRLRTVAHKLNQNDENHSKTAQNMRFDSWPAAMACDFRVFSHSKTVERLSKRVQTDRN